jgi:hypothetical protein
MLLDGNLNSYLWLTRLFTFMYFAWFAAQLPLGLFERPLPVPPSISAPVLSHAGGDGGDGGASEVSRRGPGFQPQPAAHAPETRG